MFYNFFHKLILFLYVCTKLIKGQDPSVRGLFVSYNVELDTPEISKVYSTCFEGIGMTTCSPLLPDDDFALSYILDYLEQVGHTQGGNYCLECCGTSTNNIDIWDLSCEIDGVIEQPKTALSYVGLELRLARSKTESDRTVITCPLRHPDCDYSDDGQTLDCPRKGTTFLIGYVLTINVAQYNHNFKYWNGVTSCSIESITNNSALQVGGHFQEKIILVHTPVPFEDQQLDYGKFAILSIFVLFLVYLALYCCRRKNCLYCQQKLVISWRLCYKCQFFGVQLPDPVLIKALEEKGQQLQGNIPERFPGARLCTFFCRLCVNDICGFESDFQKISRIHPLTIQEKTDDVDFSALANAAVEEAKEVQPNYGHLASMKENVMDKSLELKEKKKPLRRNDNPNILHYHPSIIYAAVKNKDAILEDVP